MADVLDYLPLYVENAASVRARLDADANAGLTTDDPRWIDTREGTFYWDVTQVVLLELVRLWDALATEVPAAASPLFAWGLYLDRHAEVFGLTRKPATRSSAIVNFVGDAGTVIPTNTVVSATSADQDAESIEFVTDTTGTTGDALDPPEDLDATPGSGGSLDTGTYYYFATAYNAFGETESSAVASASPTGPVARVDLTWSAVTGATGYRVYRGMDSTGIGGERIYDGAAVSASDIGQDGTVAGPPDGNTTAGVALSVTSSEDGYATNVPAAAISTLESPIAEIDVVYNPAASEGGLDEEDDEGLRVRVLAEFQGRGAGNVGDYTRWALAWPGVGAVYVSPTWLGPGTVQVVIMTSDRRPVPSSVVDALQADLDPVAGQGHGAAPVGASVTVQTPVAVAVSVAATVTFKDGYSLDGDGGTLGLRDEIVRSVSGYIDDLDVGEDVIYDHVKAQVYQVKGVYLVSGVTVNGGTANIAITSNPPQVATFGTAALV